MSIVFRRTAKGDEEILKRTYKLDHFHRFVLIMINGKADVDSIVLRSSEQWNPKQCLQNLEQQGFIENIDTTATATIINETGKLQQQLIAAIQEHLPNKNTKIINNILNADNTKAALTKAIDKGCMLIKLTISEELSSKLKSELYSILNNSTDF